jgi:hypothetical protein
MVFMVGATLVVTVTAYLANEHAEAARRKSKLEKLCYPPFYACLGYRPQPERNQGTFGSHKQCQFCFGECMKQKGEWPYDKCPNPN